VRNTGHRLVLHTRELRKRYGEGEGLMRAVDEVDLEVASGETVVTRARAVRMKTRQPYGGPANPNEGTRCK
jgi:hypothetical protein